MIDKKEITEIVETYLADSDRFLVSLTVSRQNNIKVFIDGDKGVTVADCIALSRHIESCLDRDNEDFTLDVSSVGVGQPLVMIRQYNNNVGRRLSIKAADDKQFKGKLIEVAGDGIWLELDKEKKKKKQKKELEPKAESKVFIRFDDILEAKVQVSFK